MAARTKKPTQPPPAPAPAPHLTDDEIAGRLLREAADERARFDKLKAQFLERFAVSPTDAMEWLGAPLAQQEAEAAMWRLAERWLSGDDLPVPPAPLAERLTAILGRVRLEQSRILENRPWELNSTSTFANLGKLYATSGRARALEMILTHVGVALTQIEERDREVF